MKSAFGSSIVPDKALKLIVEYSEKRDGNAKVAFDLLISATEIAQWNDLERIEEKHAKEAIEKLERNSISDKIREIENSNETEFKVL